MIIDIDWFSENKTGHGTQVRLDSIFVDDFDNKVKILCNQLLSTN